ncbi:MAG: hypothetical protein JWM91_1771 [Rhodospirillales bacterium]|nr:hypothetical protein [Rhodospirillales bacterium]
MKWQKSSNPYLLSLMLADLAISSCDTIASRTKLILTGQCTGAEYRLMVVEKAETAHASFFALASASPLRAFEAAMAPWLRSAKDNAQRLRQAS